MKEYQLSYCEVIPDQTVLESWKEITLNTGGTQSILQDTKFVDRAGGYCYKEATKCYTRNRIINWRISNDTLELVEYSLDINLSGSRVRYRFIDTPILDGISIHETYENVIILVPTVCSVHRLVFPHPSKFHKAEELLGAHADLSAPSIFSEASDADARNPYSYFIFSGPSFANSQLPHLASSTIAPNEEEDAIFVLVYPSGEILLVRQTYGGDNSCVELKSDSLMPRFLSGLAEKFRSKFNDSDNVVSLILHSVDLETYAITLSRNGHLKFWSCTKAHCVAIINVLAEVGDTFSNFVQGDHILRKAVDGDDADCFLSIYINCHNQSQFYIFKPIFNGAHVRIVRIHTLPSPEIDLIDFNFTTSRIWSVWRGVEGECAVYSARLKEDNIVTSWTPVILESEPAPQPPLADSESDPSQIYLQYIFHPGRFPLHIINKALSIFKRSSVLADVNLSPALLKQRIHMAVQHEIQEELKEAEVNDEDYLECANWCWQSFYSGCQQYHVAGLKPLSVLLLPSVSGAMLLKKSMFSFLRPLDALEHMMLCSEHVTKDQLRDNISHSDDPDMDAVMQLMKVVVYLEQQMSEIFDFTFENELQQLKSPDVVMSDLLEKIQNEMDNEFASQIGNMLKNCHNLYQAMHKILEILRNEPSYLDDEESSGTLGNYSQLFSSHLGISVITQCINQQAKNRFTICRNLLLICSILMKEEVVESVRSVCTPELVVLTQATYTVLWLSGLPALPVISHDLPIRKLAPLKLKPAFNIRYQNMQVLSVLQMFIESSGGYEAHKLFLKSSRSGARLSQWHFSLLPYLNHLFHIIWPISGSPILAEWLLSSSQHVWLQQYVRLLREWCEWNNCTRNFLLACSFLTSCENRKALDLFKLAAKGIFSDTFLAQRLIKYDPDENPTKAYITYWLKVIQLFELNNASDCAIDIANTVLSVDSDDPLVATLYSIKFIHHLKLKHYKAAFDSLKSNPDEKRKRDNLRDLVKCLLDERKLNILMAFNYDDLEELFVEVLLTRARAADVVENIYYDFLYAYHVKRGPGFFRLAASVMYEQAFRLSYNNNIDAVEKQVKCLLAAINSLNLCAEKFMWVARPLDREDKEEIIYFPEDLGAPEEDPLVVTVRKEVEVVGMEEIKKEYEFACAKLKLAKFSPSAYNNMTIACPEELMVALVSAGLFQVALSVCKTFRISYEYVFDAFTRKCVYLTENEHVEQGWEWLFKNDTQDLLVNNNCAADVAWLLLEECLKQYEEEGLTVLHKVICKKIIQMRAWIPHWLLASYKLRNPAELLRLLHSSGRLEEAIDIASKYMLAVMGHGKEYFGFTTTLCPTGPIMYSPVLAINALVQELEIQKTRNKDQDFSKEYEFLSELFKKYIETATRISNEMCRYRYSLVR